MQINFITQSRLIMEYGKRNKLSAHERLFHLALFHLANQMMMQTENREWPEDYFPVSNSELSSWTGLDDRAIRSLRNSLRQKGLIDFRKGDGRKSDPEYRFYYLQQSGYRIIACATDSKNAVDKPIGDKNAVDNPSIDSKNAVDYVGDTVGDSVGDSVGDTVGDDVVIDSKNAVENGVSSNGIKNKKKDKEIEIDIKSIHPSIHPDHPEEPGPEGRVEGRDYPRQSSNVIQYDTLAYTASVKSRIEYDILAKNYHSYAPLLDTMVSILVDTHFSRSDTIRVAGSAYPAELVRQRLDQLDSDHIMYVIDQIRENPYNIRNLRAYLLTMLYNAPVTIQEYYAAQVRANCL